MLTPCNQKKIENHVVSQVYNVLNSSHESSDKENTKKTMQTPTNLAKEFVPYSTKTAEVAPTHFSNYHTIKSNKNFNVSDLLNSTCSTFDGDSSHLGQTAVQHVGSSRNEVPKESISTSEVQEQLRRSKALLAELNMKRMGIPTTSIPRSKEPELDDSNMSGESTLDSKHKLVTQFNNKQEVIPSDAKLNDSEGEVMSHAPHPLASDFNDRLMKLSKTANDLRNRLSNETKILADKIPSSKAS